MTETAPIHLTDGFGRRLNYLRISVIDRCNLRCRYCVPPEGVKLLAQDDILSFEEITDTARAAADLGVRKLRLTGGEPLIRRNVIELVRELAAIGGIDDFGMSTNGTLLAEYARALAGAGLHRVNVSLDTTDAARYREITRGGDIRDVFRGIEAAREAGLTPVKLNCVVKESPDEPDARSVADYARREGLLARFIRLMDFAAGEFSIVEGGTGGDCARCNRLRLTSNGLVLPCLFSDISFSIRELGARKALLAAAAAKPEAGGPCTHDWMYRIGG